VVVVELGWAHLLDVCRIEQAAQLVMLVMDVALQLNYFLSDAVSTRQLAAIGALLSLRLRLLSFFEFKAIHPTRAYCRPMHTSLDLPLAERARISQRAAQARGAAAALRQQL